MKPNMCQAGTRKGKIKLKKRLLSILLAAVLLLGAGPLGLVDTAWAAEDWLWPAENCYIVSSNYGARDLYGTGKYSLQGTTQGRYLTGGVPPVRFSM